MSLPLLPFRFWDVSGSNLPKTLKGRRHSTKLNVSCCYSSIRRFSPDFKPVVISGAWNLAFTCWRLWQEPVPGDKVNPFH